MIHRVDFAPHACWRRYENPLTFLTVPASLWQAMGSNRGTPNRLRYGQIIEILEKIGFLHRTTASERFEDRHIREVRGELPKEQAHQSDESLVIKNAVIVADRPA